MSRPRDYYEVLGIGRNATAEQVRKAYRRLARKYHPDINKSPNAAKLFSEATEAYEVLTDPEKRRLYDQFGHAGVGAGSAAGPSGDPFGGFRSGGFSRGGFSRGGLAPDDISSLFEEMFGGGGGSPFGTTTGPGRTRPPRRGGDIEHTITVSFLTAAEGGEEHLRLTMPDGKTQSIKVRVPRGVESGARLRVRGSGQPDAHGGPRGDLILTVEVGAHPFYRREGHDLLLDVPVTFSEAALGTTVTVPLLDGSVQMKIPPGASSGRKLRIKDRGIADAHGRRGDFYAVIQIVAPDTLSEHARTLLTELAAELKNPRESGPWADDEG